MKRPVRKKGRINGRIPRLYPFGWTRTKRMWKAGWRHKRGYEEAVQRDYALKMINAMFSNDPEEHKKMGITVLATTEGECP